MKVRILSDVLQNMIDHARSEYPLECCGLLSGAGSVIDSIHRTPNEKVSTTEFFIPVQDLFQFFRQMRRERRNFLGIYHSHPQGEARPSWRDAREFFYPGTTYWIVSLKSNVPDVRCYKWVKMSFCETPFQAINAMPAP